MYLHTVVLAGILGLSAATAWAHGDARDAKPRAKKPATATEETPFGRPGDPKKAMRTINVGMNDSMHFTPGDIRLKQGDTVRFVVANKGKLMHEMVIGSMKELKEHAELMTKFPDMEHDEPYMAHVAPGKNGEIVWQFTQAGEFHYACLVPGHMQAGMIAKIAVK